MRTVTTVTTVYNFDELSEESQQKALEKLCGLNVSHDWWDFIYEDAATIGIEIQGFDTYRGTIDGKLTESLLDCCKLIRKDHGKNCETYKTAAQYLNTYIQAFIKWLSSQDIDDCEQLTIHWKPVDWLAEFGCNDEADEVTNDFRKALLEDYLSMLRREYDYLTSEEAIKESIHANEYEFTEDGSLA